MLRKHYAHILTNGGTLATERVIDALEDSAALLRQQHAAIVELREALGRCKFDSLNMTLADLEFVRATLTNTEGLSK
jgi:hypothetical protein